MSMESCECREVHERRRIVLTGGPGAGKTAVLELTRQYFCNHVTVLPEAAGLVFGGGFPRGSTTALRRAAQRAIFYVQRELEIATEDTNAAMVLCDRGTVDGAAYWPGPDELWAAVGTSREAQLARYHAVVHLRTPLAEGGYNHRNPLRIESAVEAARIDARIEECWASHPRRFVVEATTDFLAKVRRALVVLRSELPQCCIPAADPGELGLEAEVVLPGSP
jgi:predicted ATPase